MTIATLRLAVSEDIEAIRRCTAEAYQPHVSRLGFAPKPMTVDYSGWLREGQHVWVIELEDEIIAVLVLLPQPTRMLIYSIAVAPRHQRKGHAASLMQFAEAEARRRAYDRIVLYTNEKMTENIRFYEKLGYVRFDRRAHPTRKNAWLVYLHKDIGP